jgi:FkbM family methyltransferase
MRSLKSRLRLALRRALDREPPAFASANPDHSQWLAAQIWAGEYDEPGFVPSRGWRVLDIGANVGTFAVRSARRKARVVAYEPHPETFGYLRQNAPPQVDCRQAAVVAQTPDRGVVRLFLGDRDTRHSLIPADQRSGAELGDAHLAVPAVTAREALAGDWDLVKMDCEGVEFDLLDSLSSEDLRGVHRMVVELHGEDERMQAFVRRVESEGYSVSLRQLDDPRLALCFAARE